MEMLAKRNTLNKANTETEKVNQGNQILNVMLN
jgi:hypothetical protein